MLQDDRQHSEPIIPTFVIAGLVDHAHSIGLQPEAWFEGLGITVASVHQSEALISFHKATTIIRRAVRMLPAEPLGLQVGSRESLVSFGILGFAMLSSRNVREAFATGLEYHLASGSLMDVTADLDPTEVRLQLQERLPDPELLPFLCEEVFASSATIMRLMIGRDASPLRLELSYPPPSYAAAYSELFNCPIRFGSHINCLVFSSTLLDHPLATHSAASHALALTACRRLIAPAKNSLNIIGTVENLLQERLSQRTSMTHIANTLNISERSLRRQLIKAGQSFSSIRDRVMAQHAQRLLNDATLTVAHIADALGFSDTRDFRRAFLRWTGMTPRSFRQARCKQDEQK